MWTRNCPSALPRSGGRSEGESFMRALVLFQGAENLALADREPGKRGVESRNESSFAHSVQTDPNSELANASEIHT